MPLWRDQPRLAQRLNRIIDAVPGPDGHPHTNRTLAEQLTANGCSVTHTHIAHLRAGRRSNPSAHLVQGLAGAFGVPMSYFLRDDGDADDQLELLLMLRNSSVKSLVFRAHGVSAAGLEEVIRAVNDIRAREGLSDSDGPAGSCED